MDLRAHLRGDSHFRGGLGDNASFVHRVRERLFAVDVLSGFQCGDGGDGVRVVGGTDDDGVERLVVEHLAEVVVLCGFAVLGCGAGEIAIVDVAQCGDVCQVGDSTEVVAAAAGYADDADVQAIVRRL